ncbi:hypothetical protein I314_02685, partial [Cryptococcus bacillisporus CA1873]
AADSELRDTDENEDIGDKRQERTIIWEASDTASRSADKE